MGERSWKSWQTHFSIHQDMSTSTSLKILEKYSVYLTVTIIFHSA